MIRLAHPDIKEEEIALIRTVLESGFLVQGEYVEKFESAVADLLHVKHAVAVSSGTAALHLALLSLGVGDGDEVIVPDYTFPATGNVAVLAGARPVLVDIDRATYNIDPSAIESSVTPRTKAIVPVHLFGQSAQMDAVLDVARRHDLHVVEDACCALGARYRGARCGTMGDVGCFSFHPRKIVSTGEGGMVVTNSGDIADTVRSLRNHGIVSENGAHRFHHAGFNYRMTDFQGALGCVQMGRLQQLLERRVAIAALYDELLADVDALAVPAVAEGNNHVYQSYVVLLDEGIDRDGVIGKLRSANVQATIGTYALHTQPFYQREYGYRDAQLPRSYRAFKQCLSLPLHQRLSSCDVETVCGQLKSAIDASTRRT